MPKKNNRVFNSIMKGLDEVLEWSKGKTKMSVIMPGQKRKQMTRDEYEAEKAKLNEPR